MNNLTEKILVNALLIARFEPLLKRQLLLSLFLTLGVSLSLTAQCMPVFNCINKTEADGLANDWTFGIHVAGDTICIATEDGLSISRDTGKTFMTRNKLNSGLGSNVLLDVFKENGVISVATDGGGISISTDGGISFTSQPIGTQPGNGTIWGVFAVGSTVYAATHTNGLGISTDGGTSFVTKTIANGLATNFTRDVYVEGGIIYVATTDGLSISSNAGTNFTNKSTANGLGANFVNAVFANGSNIYAATTNGLSISTDGGANFTNKTIANGLASNLVNEVFFLDGVIYAATSGGLSISVDGGMTFNTTNNFGSNDVKAVYVLGNYIYLARGGGISICEMSTMTPITSSDADNIICSDDIVTFTASGGTNYKFLLNNDVIAQNGVSATYTTDSLKNGDKVKVLVTTAAGCILTSPEITTSVNTFVDILTVTDPIATGTYRAKTTVKSAGTILSGTTVTFIAGSSFIMEPGFTVQSGATFKTILLPCNDPIPFTNNPTAKVRHAPTVTTPIIRQSTLDFTIQPNPFYDETTLIVSLKATDNLSIQVFDQTGKLVKQLVKTKNVMAGAHHFRLGRETLYKGLFYIQVQTDMEQIIKKVILAR